MKKGRLEELREELNKLVDKLDINLHDGEVLILSQKLDYELNLLKNTGKKVYI